MYITGKWGIQVDVIDYYPGEPPYRNGHPDNWDDGTPGFIEWELRDRPKDTDSFCAVLDKAEELDEFEQVIIQKYEAACYENEARSCYYDEKRGVA